jgi:hypothetical protein
MIIRGLPILTLIIFSGQLFSQKPITVYLYGTISAEDTMAIRNVNIINISSGIGTISNHLGQFAVPVGSSDTVKLTYMGYRPLKYIIPNVVLSDILKNFKLFPDTILLEEAIVYPYPATALQLKRELVGLNLIESALDFNLHLDKVPITPDPQTGMVIKGPITALYDRFSRSGKLNRYHEHKIGGEKIKEKVAMVYNSDLIKKITGLTNEKEIKKFMDFCNLQPEFILNVSDYELYLAILDCFKDFNNSPE